MKNLLFLLFSIATFGQVSTGQETPFDYGIQNTAAQLVGNSDYVVTQGNDGTYGKYTFNLNNIEKKQFLSTGLIKNGLITINADPTKYNITAGIGIITNYDNPEIPVCTIVNFPAVTAKTPTYLTTGNITYIAINSSGVVVEQANAFTTTQRRDLIILGAVIHSNLTTINVVNNLSAPVNADTNQLHDFMEAVGALNFAGNKYSANGANLSLDKSSGTIFKAGVNFANDWKRPHFLDQSAGTALTFRYRLSGGLEGSDTTVLNPAVYESLGAYVAVPPNKFTIQTVTMFQTGLTRIQPGQAYYNSLEEAQNAILTRSFVVENNIAMNGLTRAYIVLRNSTASLQNAADAKIVEAQKFGGVASGGVALTDTAIIAALGYTPENLANKQNSLSVDGSGIKYPTVDAISLGTTYKRTIAQIRALSGTLPNNNFYTTDLEQEGHWFYDSTDTTSADNTGTILVTSDGKRIKRAIDGYVLDSWFGTKGDGVTDDSSAMQLFLNSSGFLKKIAANKNYKIETTLTIFNPIDLDINNSTIFSNTLKRLISINGNNSSVKISNGKLKVNTTGDFTIVAETEEYANSWIVGAKMNPSELLTSVVISNCYFSSEFGSINGVKLISHRSGTGGTIKNVSIRNCNFDKIGRMGVEVLGELATEYYSEISIRDNIFDDLGKFNIYGMAISLSGLGSKNTIENNFISQAKDVCIENAGANETIIVNNTISNPKSDTTPLSVNSLDSGIQGFRNVSKNNRFNGAYARGCQILYQNNYFSENNYLQSSLDITQINNVSNSIFIADVVSVTNANAMIITNNSISNKFDKCVFDTSSSTSYIDIVNCNGAGVTGNYFTNNNFIPTTFGGNYLTQSSGATNNIVEKNILKDALSTLYDYGISDAVTIDTEQEITNKKTFSGAFSTVDNFARAFWFKPTITQSQDYSTLIAIDLQPVFSMGSSVGDGGFIAIRSNSKINYSSNISSSYDDRSLIDKGYAESVFSTITSPTFTGTPTAPTATTGTNTTQIATTAFVQDANTAVVGTLEVNSTDRTIWNNGKSDISENTSFGESSLKNITSGSYNTSNGRNSLLSDTTGAYNTALGYASLSSNVSGDFNLANGYIALASSVSGSSNVAVGSSSLYNLSSGSGNTSIGDNSGLNINSGILTTANNSLFLGKDTKALSNSNTNEIVIGYNATGAGSNTVTLGNTSVVKTVLRGVVNYSTPYTVATLPTGTQGDTAFVTDALTPTYLGILIGGGAVVCPVFYNGTTWISH